MQKRVSLAARQFEASLFASLLVLLPEHASPGVATQNCPRPVSVQSSFRAFRPRGGVPPIDTQGIAMAGAFGALPAAQHNFSSSQCLPVKNCISCLVVTGMVPHTTQAPRSAAAVGHALVWESGHHASDSCES